MLSLSEYGSSFFTDQENLASNLAHAGSRKDSLNNLGSNSGTSFSLALFNYIILDMHILHRTLCKLSFSNRRKNYFCLILVLPIPRKIYSLEA